MNSFRVAALFLVALVVTAWAILCIVDRVRPEPEAPEAYYPTVGQVLRSRAEGFTQRIIKSDRNSIWVELTLAPHAPGPPAHIHTAFAEQFLVAKGSLSLRVGAQVKVLHEGESFRVEPGIVHQPFNASDAEVVVRGPLTPEYAIPRKFGLFLSQIYGFIDESPAHSRPPAILFQMAIFAPRYDTWMTAPSLGIQRTQSAVLRPIARMLGYRSYYERFVPQPAQQAG